MWLGNLKLSLSPNFDFSARYYKKLIVNDRFSVKIK